VVDAELFISAAGDRPATYAALSVSIAKARELLPDNIVSEISEARGPELEEPVGLGAEGGERPGVGRRGAVRQSLCYRRGVHRSSSSRVGRWATARVGAYRRRATSSLADATALVYVKPYFRGRSRMVGYGPMAKRKDPHAVALGRKGGKKGGKARWSGVSPEERSRLMRETVLRRWRRTRAG